MSEPSNDNGLMQRLQAIQIEWPENEYRYFVPVDAFERLLTRPSIRAELGRIYGGALDERGLDHYVDRIYPDSRKIFAIVIYGSSGTCSQDICDIVNEGITDSLLPFSRGYSEQDKRYYNLCTREHQKCPMSDHMSCGIKALLSRSQIKRADLDRDQWLVQAPVFIRSPQGEIPHLNLERNVVLPFIEDHQGSPELVRTGGYSDVWGVRIHSAHQHLLRSTDPKGPLLAIKRLRSRNSEEFAQELKMLTRLTQKNHDHLVKLLATYKLKDHYHLIFPYAQSNLRAYWNLTGPPNYNKATCLWFLEQIAGLTSGLCLIHDFPVGSKTNLEPAHPDLALYSRRLVKSLRIDPREVFGRHGDLKPENILWSNDLHGTPEAGILQIADFGLGRFHRLESRSAQDPRKVQGSATYAPPEVALETPVSRKYDIWSLGCVFLEFLTWLIEGPGSVYEFSNRRYQAAGDGVEDDTYFTIFNPENRRPYAEVRKGVTEWIERLRQSPRRSSMTNAFLAIIQNEMIRVNSDDRTTATILTDKIQRMLAEARKTPAYLIGNDLSGSGPDNSIKIPPKGDIASVHNSDSPQGPELNVHPPEL